MTRFVGSIAILSLLLIGAYIYSASIAREIEQQHPPAGKYITVEDVRIHYADLGEGEPIVLIHGASANLSDLLSSLGPHLAKNYRIIAFDRPGYGYSERPQGQWVNPAHQARLLRKALVKLDVVQPVLVGHSIGAAVTLAFALDYPLETAGVALLGGAAYPWQGGVDWTNHVATWPLIGSVFVSTCIIPAASLMLDDALAEVFAPNVPTRDYKMNASVELSLRPGPFRASAEDVLRLSEYLEGQSERYDSLLMPMVLITGDDDRIVPAWNHAHRLAALLAHAQLVEFKKTGHVPHHVHPKRVANLIANLRERTRHVI